MSCRSTFRAALSSGTFASETKLLRATGRGGHSHSCSQFANNECQARAKSNTSSTTSLVSPSIKPAKTRYLCHSYSHSRPSSYSLSTQSNRHLSTLSTATTTTTASPSRSPSLLATFSSTTMSSMSKTSSWDVLAEASKNKDTAFTVDERVKYGLTGLLPSAIRTLEEQIEVAMKAIRLFSEPISKYMYLRNLQDWNEKLFFSLLTTHTEELMPIVYTPVVGEACQKFSLLYMRPRGLFISSKDKGQIKKILANCPYQNIRAICVTDGERILGLGDLGANGMGIPIGKLALYSALSGIDPKMLLPVTLDVGTNNESFLKDPSYIGLREKRLTGPEYDQLVEEFMTAATDVWGANCLIQFEDFGNSNAFRLLEKYQESYCTFNDDIQGTASVTAAGIIASTRITKLQLKEQTFLFYGAGEAAIGTAKLLVTALLKQDLTEEEARSRIWLFDSKGLVTLDRATGGVTHHKAPFAKKAEDTRDLVQAIKVSKATGLIGVSAQAGVFTPQVLEQMARQNERPLVFPLSNPTSKAECTAKEAFEHTGGKCVFASGSPFDSLLVNGQMVYPGQGNNAYIFPGVAMAAIFTGAKAIPDETFLVAAESLAEQVTQEDILEGRLFPPLSSIREVTLKIAAASATFLYQERLATYQPEPKDKLQFIRSNQYSFEYN